MLQKSPGRCAGSLAQRRGDFCRTFPSNLGRQHVYLDLNFPCLGPDLKINPPRIKRISKILPRPKFVRFTILRLDVSSLAWSLCKFPWLGPYVCSLALCMLPGSMYAPWLGLYVCSLGPKWARPQNGPGPKWTRQVLS